MRIKEGMVELAKGLEDPAFKRKCEIYARNRHSENGGDEAGLSRHTGGSISTIKTAKILAEKIGCEPTPMEVFTCTQMKDHDWHIFVNRCAMGINENYSAAR